jgi:hypothetical protein
VLCWFVHWTWYAFMAAVNLRYWRFGWWCMLLYVAETYFRNLQAYGLYAQWDHIASTSDWWLVFATLVLIIVFATSLVYRKWGFLGNEGILFFFFEGKRRYSFPTGRGRTLSSQTISVLFTYCFLNSAYVDWKTFLSRLNIAGSKPG